jgi:hypothetical protein
MFRTRITKAWVSRSSFKRLDSAVRRTAVLAVVQSVIVIEEFESPTTDHQSVAADRKLTAVPQELVMICLIFAMGRVTPEEAVGCH